MCTLTQILVFCQLNDHRNSPFEQNARILLCYGYLPEHYDISENLHFHFIFGFTELTIDALGR